MQTLNVAQIYDRGLADFSALMPLERDVFVVHDLNLYYEMEGGFEDYLLSGGHTAELDWLTGTLQRAQDQASATILIQLMALAEHNREQMGALCDHFYHLMESRWEAVERYLRQQGGAVAW